MSEMKKMKSPALRALLCLLCAMSVCAFAFSGFAEGADDEIKKNKVVSSGATEDLDSRCFVLVTWLKGGDLGACLTQEAHQVAGRINAIQVSREAEEDVLYSDGNMPVWMFRQVGDGLYTLRAENGEYLNLNADGAVLSGMSQELTVETDDKYPGQVRIGDGEKRAINLKNGSIGKGFQAPRSRDQNEWFTLYEIDKPLEPWRHIAQKVSARDVKSGDVVVVYSSAWNWLTGAFDFSAVDGEGTLKKLYDFDDEVRWMGTDSMLWEVQAQGNGFTLCNQETGRYLSPCGGGFISQEPVELTLEDGRTDGYTALIRQWAGTEGRWYSLHAGNSALAASEGGTEFAFARYSSDELPREIQAVNNDELGVTVRVYNFSKQETMANVLGNDPYIADEVRHVVRSTLGKAGYPVSLWGVELDEMFNLGYVGKASHFFVKSVYDATGFLVYDCQRCFARYDTSLGRFVLYRGLGVPVESKNRASVQHGNFFPFNTLNWNKLSSNTNQYHMGVALSPNDPSCGDPLYLFADKLDYYFGVSVEGYFRQGKGGWNQWNVPQLCEVWSDDDAWLFVDGVLVLDVGGIHSALGGQVDFSTGEVTVNGETTQLRDLFRNAGASTDDFDGDTFREGTMHTLKIFYLERGAGSANLEIVMNLAFEKWK